MKEMIKKLQRKSNKKGFTLVEIIVVLVILAILAAIAVPAVLGYINDAKESKYISETRSIYVVVQVEEAKTKSEKENPKTYGLTSTEYAKIATTAKDKTDLFVKSISKSGNVYTIDFNSSDGKGIEATLTKNTDVKVEVQDNAYSEN